MSKPTGGTAKKITDAERQAMSNEEAFSKDWEHKCEVCGQLPTVKATGLCGPCTWGEADTAGGNW